MRNTSARTRRFYRSAVAMIIAAGIASPSASAAFTPGDLVNLTIDADANSELPSISANGLVAFKSDAANLSPNDSIGSPDVFLWNNGAFLNLTEGGDGISYNAGISSNGEAVAFTSAATNLTPDPDNGHLDVFVWNDGTIKNLTADGNGVSAGSAISADGKTVAFQSSASNLTARDTNGKQDIFVWDGATFLNITEGANDSSFSPSISDDGATVTFHSAASNLTPTDTNDEQDIFVWRDGVTTNITENGDDSSSGAVVSADGSTVAFISTATNLTNDPSNGQRNLMVWQNGTITNLTTLGTGPASTPALSADGNVIAFGIAEAPVPGAVHIERDVYVWDNGVYTNLTPDIGGSASGPTITDDGSTVVFHSSSDDLVAGDSNASVDLFMVERATCFGLDITVDIAAGDSPTDGNDVIYGTPINDVINTGLGNDVVCGGGGDDTITLGGGDSIAIGGDGDDTINGGNGNDVIYGSSGDDIINGGDGNDVLLGEAGSDRVNGDGGTDYIDGGDGNDFLSATNDGSFEIDDGGGNQLHGRAGNDGLSGAGGNDILLGYEGQDSLYAYGGADYLWGGDDNDELFGGDGNDYLDEAGATGNDLMSGDDGDDIILGHDGDDSLFGSQGSDYMWGGNDDDEVFGGDGNDYLDEAGATGNDTLWGEEGNDTLLSHEGDDQLFGGTDSDYLWGGPGNDTLDGEQDIDTCADPQNGAFSQNCEFTSV